jgi:hypothetical protein
VVRFQESKLTVENYSDYPVFALTAVVQPAGGRPTVLEKLPRLDEHDRRWYIDVPESPSVTDSQVYVVFRDSSSVLWARYADGRLRYKDSRRKSVEAG